MGYTIFFIIMKLLLTTKITISWWWILGAIAIDIIRHITYEDED